ncbi:MAG: YidC/Oxa1 family membrane protein insertase [Candidatus Faecousia sp.]|nr:YidC/Oxa1 family membrane protein insertase [Clostridiales bacterium]MDD7652734.1 YidC/Oxa1 family membrane protein insertase [Bacillota bacterium]MDY4219651.1 YidC/Oxa1 family membrane protein insertase [Candidatus Faecousia sp.]
MFLAFSISDIIRVPFGYVLDWLYQFINNYGLALILFSLIVKLILLPISAKSKKSMMQMSRMAPLTQAIQNKYPDDPQKANLEISKIYKEEGVSMFGGCLWSLIPLLLIFPLFYVIRQPLEYMLHFTSEQAAQIVEIIKAELPDAFRANSYYDQVYAAPYLGQFAEQIKEAMPELANKTIPSLNFNFLGVNLGQIPSFTFWKWDSFSWNNIGAFLLPVLSAGSQVLSMFISQKLNSSVSTDDQGNVDQDAAKASAKTNKYMMWIMPLFSLWIGFSYPCSLSIYWLSQGIFGMVQDVLLTKHYRKLYDAEDNIKRRIAAEQAAIEAEKERIRAQRRAENPDGIVENTSKKKLQRQQQLQKEQASAAGKKAAAQQSAEENEDCPSGDPERPFCKGRAYRADHYREVKGKNTEE